MEKAHRCCKQVSKDVTIHQLDASGCFECSLLHPADVCVCSLNVDVAQLPFHVQLASLTYIFLPCGHNELPSVMDAALLRDLKAEPLACQREMLSVFRQLPIAISQTEKLLFSPELSRL